MRVTGTGQVDTAPGGPLVPPLPAPPLAEQDMLARRYRLLAPLAAGGPAVLWRAADEVLARDVAVKVLDARAVRSPFLDAAVRAGALAHPGLAKTYDAAVEERDQAGTAYVINEWVDGQALADVLREGPLDPVEAVGLLRQAADALTSAHHRGVPHGRVHPGNVLVTASGRLRLTDTCVAAAVHGAPVGAATPQAVRADTRDLAAVLYALLTASWPSGATPQPAGGLPTARERDAHAYSPRQVRAAVPRSLDLVVSRGLDPSRHPGTAVLATPAALALAAEQAAEQVREARVADAQPRPPSRLRRFAPWLAALAALLAVGTGGWLLGLAVGEVPRRANGVEPVLTTTAPSAPAGSPATAPPPIDLTRLSVRDFDPPPGDGQESPDKVHNAVDLDPSTAWVTDRYNTSHFGGLKTGVGLLVDLGASTAVTSVQVQLTATGAAVELRAADTPAATADGYRVVAQNADTGPVATLTPAAGERARYWLVWLTALPGQDSGYREGISELRFR